MTIRSAAIIATGLALAFLGGRMSKPARVEVREVVKVKVKEVTSEKAGAVGRVALRNSDSAASQERVVTRIVTRPGGERIIEKWRDTGNQHLATSQATETVVEYRDRYITKEAESTKVTLSPQTRWTLTAIYGKTWDWKTEAGGVLSVRVAGPFTLSVWGTNRAAGVGAGVTW